MKRVYMRGIIASIAIMACGSCTKLYEHIEEEHIHRPQYDVEYPSDKEWDSEPNEYNEIGK